MYILSIRHKGLKRFIDRHPPAHPMDEAGTGDIQDRHVQDDRGAQPRETGGQQAACTKRAADLRQATALVGTAHELALGLQAKQRLDL